MERLISELRLKRGMGMILHALVLVESTLININYVVYEIKFPFFQVPLCAFSIVHLPHALAHPHGSPITTSKPAKS